MMTTLIIKRAKQGETNASVGFNLRPGRKCLSARELRSLCQATPFRTMDLSQAWSGAAARGLVGEEQVHMANSQTAFMLETLVMFGNTVAGLFHKLWYN